MFFANKKNRPKNYPEHPHTAKNVSIYAAPKKLHPAVRLMLYLTKLFQKEPNIAALRQTPVETIRTQNAALAARLRNFAAPQEQMQNIQDITIPTDPTNPHTQDTITLRLYTPRPHSIKPLPVVLYFHGGGFVVGSVDSLDLLCRSIACGAECLVVSVGYRLAPEHPFPAAVHDASSALAWVQENIQNYGGDATRLAIAGDSAGGNLAAVLAHHARDHKVLGVQQGVQHKILLQVLLYPVLDCTCSSESYSRYAEGYFLTRDYMYWFLEQYIDQSGTKATRPDRTHPDLSPLYAEDVAELPPALIISAEYDPLCDEAALYAKRLQQAGIAVEFTCYGGMMHGFMMMPNLLKPAQAAVAQMIGALRKALLRENDIGNKACTD